MHDGTVCSQFYAHTPQNARDKPTVPQSISVRAAFVGEQLSLKRHPAAWCSSLATFLLCMRHRSAGTEGSVSGLALGPRFVPATLGRDGWFLTLHKALPPFRLQHCRAEGWELDLKHSWLHGTLWTSVSWTLRLKDASCRQAKRHPVPKTLLRWPSSAPNNTPSRRGGDASDDRNCDQKEHQCECVGILSQMVV